MELKIPSSLKLEHEALHEMLRTAMREPGELGDVAKALGKLMHLHFVKEQKYALPPLGLLGALANGELRADMSNVLAMTERLRVEMPGMLREHKAILAMLGKFSAVASRANKTQYADFASRLTQHAQIEEQVSYPAALLVGEYVRSKLAAANEHN
jgi:Hemerythrin HHE cation binding domain